MAKISPYTEALQALGVECIYCPFYWSVEEYFRKNRMPVDVVYLHRFSNASKYAGMVRGHQPQARLIYNVADLHYLRMEREAELTGSAEVAKRAATMRHDELSAAQAVDVTIVHSAVEKSVLAEAAPQGNVHVVPWAYRLRPVEALAATRRGVVFVGGYRHPPNVDAAKWLVNHIMPLVWAELPDIGVTMVGSHMPDEVKALGSARVEALGYTPDVNDVYERRLISVAPLRFGAGVKGKVLEAFAAGVPCVMTTCAAEGVALSEDLLCLVGNDAEGLARRIIDLHNDVPAVERLAEAGLAMMESAYSAAAVDAALAATLVKASPPA
jgi:glycosyltransferase involved in cell wall biosynthesis